MNWREAEAAAEAGAAIRRASWAPTMFVHMEGARLVLKKPLPGLNCRDEKRSDAGWPYNPSMEATKAVDWESIG